MRSYNDPSTEWRILQDDDCHWYMVPAELALTFYQWVEDQCSEEPEDDTPPRGCICIDGPHNLIITGWEEIEE